MINLTKLNPKLRTLYKNYRFTTNKMRKLYYESPYYKRLLSYLHIALIKGVESDTKKNQEIAPYLEAIDYDQFELLCKLHEIGKLDDLVKLIKIASQE